MKKNLLTLLFALSVLCVGAFTVNAKTPHSSGITAKSAKTSASETEIKLAKIRSIIKTGQAMRNSMCMDCLDMLEQIEGQWNWAQFVCWSGWGSCQGAIDATLRLGEIWDRAGCNYSLGSVTAKNINRKIWLMRKETTKIG